MQVWLVIRHIAGEQQCNMLVIGACNKLLDFCCECVQQCNTLETCNRKVEATPVCQYVQKGGMFELKAQHRCTTHQEQKL